MLSISVLGQPPYSLYLFLKLKGIKGIHFEGVKAITMKIRDIPEESFEQCREGWESALDLSGITLKEKPCSLSF